MTNKYLEKLAEQAEDVIQLPNGHTMTVAQRKKLFDSMVDDHDGVGGYPAWDHDYAQRLGYDVTNVSHPRLHGELNKIRKTGPNPTHWTTGTTLGAGLTGLVGGAAGGAYLGTKHAGPTIGLLGGYAGALAGMIGAGYLTSKALNQPQYQAKRNFDITKHEVEGLNKLYLKKEAADDQGSKKVSVLGSALKYGVGAAAPVGLLMGLGRKGVSSSMIADKVLKRAAKGKPMNFNAAAATKYSDKVTKAYDKVTGATVVGLGALAAGMGAKSAVTHNHKVDALMKKEAGIFDVAKGAFNAFKSSAGNVGQNARQLVSGVGAAGPMAGGAKAIRMDALKGLGRNRLVQGAGLVGAGYMAGSAMNKQAAEEKKKAIKWITVPTTVVGAGVGANIGLGVGANLATLSKNPALQAGSLIGSALTGLSAGGYVGNKIGHAIGDK